MEKDSEFEIRRNIHLALDSPGSEKQIRVQIRPKVTRMSDRGKALITGASGFVGSAVARKLIERGFSIRALIRSTSPTANLSGLDMELTIGDLRDPASVKKAMSGIR